MKQLIKLVFAVSLFVVSVGVIAAGNIEAGKEKSASCVACHGKAGISASPLYPIIAGQHEDYLVRVLHAYKSGARTNLMMKGMVGGLSDEDIADLAAYFSVQTSLKTLKK